MTVGGLGGTDEEEGLVLLDGAVVVGVGVVDVGWDCLVVGRNAEVGRVDEILPLLPGVLEGAAVGLPEPTWVGR